MKIDGACHCGFITFEAEVDPEKTTVCHCADCQTLSGSPYRASVPTTPDKFRLLSGEPTIYVKTAESGSKRAQAFCPKCGSPIYATAVRRSDRVPEHPRRDPAPARRARAEAPALGPLAPILGRQSSRDRAARQTVGLSSGRTARLSPLWGGVGEGRPKRRVGRRHPAPHPLPTRGRGGLATSKLIPAAKILPYTPLTAAREGPDCAPELFGGSGRRRARPAGQERLGGARKGPPRARALARCRFAACAFGSGRRAERGKEEWTSWVS